MALKSGRCGVAQSAGDVRTALMRTSVHAVHPADHDAAHDGVKNEGLIHGCGLDTGLKNLERRDFEGVKESCRRIVAGSVSSSVQLLDPSHSATVMRKWPRGSLPSHDSSRLRRGSVALQTEDFAIGSKHIGNRTPGLDAVDPIVLRAGTGRSWSRCRGWRRPRLIGIRLILSRGRRSLGGSRILRLLVARSTEHPAEEPACVRRGREHRHAGQDKAHVKQCGRTDFPQFHPECSHSE